MAQVALRPIPRNFGRPVSVNLTSPLSPGLSRVCPHQYTSHHPTHAPWIQPECLCVLVFSCVAADFISRHSLHIFCVAFQKSARKAGSAPSARALPLLSPDPRTGAASPLAIASRNKSQCAVHFWNTFESFIWPTGYPLYFARNGQYRKGHAQGQHSRPCQHDRGPGQSDWISVCFVLSAPIFPFNVSHNPRKQPEQQANRLPSRSTASNSPPRPPTPRPSKAPSSPPVRPST